MATMSAEWAKVLLCMSAAACSGVASEEGDSVGTAVFGVTSSEESGDDETDMDDELGSAKPVGLGESRKRAHDPWIDGKRKRVRVNLEHVSVKLEEGAGSEEVAALREDDAMDETDVMAHGGDEVTGLLGLSNAARTTGMADPSSTTPGDEAFAGATDVAEAAQTQGDSSFEANWVNVANRVGLLRETALAIFQPYRHLPNPGESLAALAIERNDAWASTLLGLMHAGGYGVPKDLRKAFDLFTLAAAQKLAAAQFGLGFCYERGDVPGVPQDLRKAFDLYALAAEQKLARAQSNLGVLYKREDVPGVLRDLRTAFDLFTLAAEQKCASAQCSLGFHYERGDVPGVPRDLRRAFDLYTLAAEQKYAIAQYNLGVRYEFGDVPGVPRDLRKAFDLYTLAAEQKHAKAQNLLGFHYDRGDVPGVPRDLRKAFDQYALAAAQKVAAAIMRLQNAQFLYDVAQAYHEGIGGPRNLAKASELYMAASQKSPAIALQCVGKFCAELNAAR